MSFDNPRINSPQIASKLVSSREQLTPSRGGLSDRKLVSPRLVPRSKNDVYIVNNIADDLNEFALISTMKEIAFSDIDYEISNSASVSTSLNFETIFISLNFEASIYAFISTSIATDANIETYKL